MSRRSPDEIFGVRCFKLTVKYEGGAYVVLGATTGESSVESVALEAIVTVNKYLEVLKQGSLKWSTSTPPPQTHAP